jgi:predicted HD phosphohydrolase
MSQHNRNSLLLKPDWQYIDKLSLQDFKADDWSVLNAQRAPYHAEQQAKQVLRMLADSRDDPTFGYRVNNYRHSLQSATMALRDGLPEEDVVVALLHDIGFVVCPDMHGAFAADLLGAYISDRNDWMLRRHAIFQNFHSPERPDVDQQGRERWRGHPHFEWAANFVAKYDQAAFDPAYECATLDVFEPLVHRVFARTPRPRPQFHDEVQNRDSLPKGAPPPLNPLTSDGSLL